jgi:hypothetical protein
MVLVLTVWRAFDESSDTFRCVPCGVFVSKTTKHPPAS